MAKKLLYPALSFIPVVAPVGTADVLFAHSPDVVPYQRTVLYQSIAEPVPIVAAAPTVTVDEWLSALSQPQVRKKPTDYQVTAFVKVDDAVVPSYGWATPFSVPVKARPQVPRQDSAFVSVVAPPSPGSGDVLFAQTVTTLLHQKATLYQSVADPIPIISGETVTVDKWFRSLTEPTRRGGFPAYEQQALAFVKAAPFPESVSIDRWGQPLSEPIRRKIKPPEAASAFVSVVSAPSPGSGDVLFSQINQSVIVSKSLLYQSVFEPVRFTATPPVVVSVDSWYRPLSTPPDAGFGSIDLSVTFAAVEPSFAWYQPLNEPPRRKVSVTPHPTTAFVPVVAAPEVITVDKWFRPLVEPVRRTGLAASEQQALTLGPFPVTASLNGWGQPFSEPQRRRARVDVSQPVFVHAPAPEVVTVDKWYRDFNPPTLPRSYKAALAPYYFASNYLVPAPYVDPPMASWSYSWSLPVLVRTSIMTAAQTSGVIPVIPQPNPPPAPGVYTVSGLYVTDQFTDNTVVYDYGGGVSHRTN